MRGLAYVSASANAIRMTTPNQRDRALILRLAESVGASPSQLATMAGVASSTLTRVVNGSSRLSLPTLEKLQAKFPDDFGDLDEVPDTPASLYEEVEVLPSFAGMGGGGFGDGEPGRALLPRKLIREQLHAAPADLLLIDVRGDSMEPDFRHGDQLLIDRRDADPAQPGPFALWDGDTYVVKLLERVPMRRDRIRIFSSNDRYASYEAAIDEVRILGRPVWLGRTL